MKTTSMVGALLVSLPALAAPEVPEIRPSSAPISAVLVYPDGAVVTRRARVSLPAGRATVVFEGLSPLLDEASLLAKVGGGGTRVSGVSAAWQGSLEPLRDPEAKLEAAIARLDAEVQALDDSLAALSLSRQVFEQYRNLARQAIDQQAAERAGGPGAGPGQKWKDSLGWFTQQQDALTAQQRTAQQKKAELLEERQSKNNELSRLRAGDARKTRRVEVELEADHALEAEVALSYAVPQAAWYPAYDARENGEAKLALDYFGTVVQQSGEDWKEVSLTLSTARPSEGAQVPRLGPLTLSGMAREKRPVQIVSYGKKKAKLEATKDAEGEPLPLDAAGRAKIDDKGSAITFVVEGRESIPADHRPHKVQVAALSLGTTLAYETVPKVAPWVYLKATAKDESAFPLLAGEVSVFRRSGFIGSGRLEYVAPGEEFALSLGADDEIKVRRTIDQKVDSKPRLLGSTRQIAYGYEIELENYKGEAQEVTVVENVPVTERKEIKVSLADSTTKPDQQDDQGFLRWKVKVDPGGRRTLLFGYSVEYPASFQIGGL